MERAKKEGEMEGDRKADKSGSIEISSGMVARRCRQEARKMAKIKRKEKARKSILRVLSEWHRDRFVHTRARLARWRYLRGVADMLRSPLSR